jgi:thiamine-monophosphate kinase
MNEFDIIQHFCSFQTIKRSDVILGSGDDCAIITVPPTQQVAITMDTLIAGVHFPLNTSAYDIGYKSLAVNLSDLAAMGAEPAWVTFALTAPHIEKSWLEELACGFFNLATAYNVQLIGGDLTRGPLSITLQAQGLITKGKALTRSGAKVGDLIYVSGTLGDAALALEYLQKSINIKLSNREYLLTKLNRPQPQVNLAKKLQGIATAAIDISDGLAADLSHILEKSQVGAIVDIQQLPLSPALRESVSLEKAIYLALNGGDDYELCFTIPPSQKALLETILAEENTPAYCIGQVTHSMHLALEFNGTPYKGLIHGYQHF